MKQNWRPGTMIYPLPAVMVSCGETESEYNILTVAWVGTICSDPAMCYISIRPERHSYPIIKRTGEFVINLTTEALAKATDWCGVKSGKDCNKFAEMGLTAGKAGKHCRECLPKILPPIRCLKILPNRTWPYGIPARTALDRMLPIQPECFRCGTPTGNPIFQ